MRFVVLAAFVLLPSLAAQQPSGLLACCERFTGFDLDGDGAAEIRSCEPSGSHAPALPGRVIALVESRLAGDPALASRLQRWGEDLLREDLGLDLVSIELADSGAGRHRDGQLLLAVRELLRFRRTQEPGLEAVVLVGHFPDALLVRTVNWHKHERIVTGKGTPDPHDWGKARFVRRVPEIVAHRADVVLGDLDGGWEDLWVEGPVERPTTYAVFGDAIPEQGGPALAVDRDTIRLLDCFLVEDGACSVDGLQVTLDPDSRDHECTAADRERPNPLPRPELQVGRIDARGLAWRGDVADPALERQLLLEYFDRNHAFRTRPAGAAFRPASVAHELGSGMHALQAASPEWQGFAETGYDCRHGVDLAELTAWMQRPAVLRTLRAHSGPHHAAFAKGSDAARLGELLGIDEVPRTLTARLAQGRADAEYWRALWQHAAAGDTPHLLLHTGCEALSPPASSTVPYDDPRYGRDAHGAAMLFFTPAVAILGRAKVFYDEPRGFAETLAAAGTIGAAWRRYFEIESEGPTWSSVGGDIGRKRATFWSVLGDPTLRLPGK